MLEKIIVVALLFVFILFAIVPRIIQKLKKVETLGCIGIYKEIFALGKLSLFSSLALIPIQLFGVRLSLFESSDIFLWLCIALLGIGITFFAAAINKLGTFSLRVGLAKDETKLQTTGIYRVSRNPMLFGLYLMALGSAVYVQNPANWLLVTVAVIVHNRIILTEEDFLKNRFGTEWLSYRARVRRYI